MVREVKDASNDIKREIKDGANNIKKNIDQDDWSYTPTSLFFIDRDLTISNIESASFGLLINSSENLHSVKYSSPLKYFEYLYAGLKVIAINFPSHRILPFADNISFFDENDQESFIRAIQNSFTLEPINKKDLVNITMESRINKIISLINK